MKTLRRCPVVLALLLVVVMPLLARKNLTVTVVSGTPVRLSSESFNVRRILIEMATGGSGVGYVMAGITGHTPSYSVDADVSAELFAATSTAPGGWYGDATQASGPPDIDLSTIWVDGAHTGDKIRVTYEQ